MSDQSKVIYLFPAQNVPALVRQSESAHRQAEPDDRTIRELLADLADHLEAEANYLADCPDRTNLESSIQNLSHFAGGLRALVR